MVAKLIPGAGSTVTDADLVDFLALASAEQQLVFLLSQLQEAQTAFNTTDPLPLALINRVAIVPNSEIIAGQMTCPISNSAPLGALWEACQSIGASETPLQPAGGDTVTDAGLQDLLDITTLTGQIVYMSSVIEAAEMAYNEANPEAPENAVSVGSNYDQRQAAVSLVFPLSGGGLASLVGGLAY